MGASGTSERPVLYLLVSMNTASTTDPRDPQRQPSPWRQTKSSRLKPGLYKNPLAVCFSIFPFLITLKVQI